MRRWMVLLVVWGLVLIGCTGTSGDSTVPAEPSSTTVTPSSTAGETTTTSVETTSTTTIASTTTTAASTTTVAPTTTTGVPERPVTVGPNLPTAQGGHLVDWDAVGPGWILALYDATDLVTATTGPTVLYLVDPSGTRYEVASWPSGPYEIADWAGSGDAALVLHGGGGASIVDLRTGTETATITLPSEWTRDPVSFTAPTGMNVVVLTDDGTTHRVERRTRSGGMLAVLWEQPEPASYRDNLAWLYGYDGTFVLIEHPGGIALVENDGTFVRDLWVPMGHRCTPVRWWTADSFVAACTGEGPAFPHDDYSQAWILKTDGTAGDFLNAIPSGSIPVVDFGFSDSWQIPGRTFVQWTGDCGAAGVYDVAPDRSVGSMALTTGRFLEVGTSDMVIHRWAACDGSEGEVVRVDLSGADMGDVVPRVGDAWGVRDAASLAAMYP